MMIGGLEMNNSDVIECTNSSNITEIREEKGRQDLARDQRLPKKLNDIYVPEEIRWDGVYDSMEWRERTKIVTQNNIEYTRQQYEQMGIVIVEEYNDLFWSVILPEGWKIEATAHLMWKNLVDNKGRKRADFFYKAAFYDRDAFINFDTRYHAIVDHVADVNSKYEVWARSDYQGIVKDGEEVIFSTECIPVTGSYEKDDEVKEKLRLQLNKYLEENYPDYKNIHAYWN